MAIYAILAAAILYLQPHYYSISISSTANKNSESERRTSVVDISKPHLDVPRLMDQFLAAKQQVLPTIPPFVDKEKPFQQCLYNYTALSGPFLDSYAELDTSQQRQLAESFWLKQRGKLWMSHSRKAGGTTLCMSLHLNERGLVQSNAEQWQMPRRKTCQIMNFCPECDLTRAKPDSPGGRFQGWGSVPRLVDCVTRNTNRNFIEFEGTVSPPDLLTNPEYANFVFISTLRHPIARTISSLHNDHLFNAGGKNKNCFKPDQANELNPCAHNFISNATDIMRRCHYGVYFCYSNYFVRTFAGHPNGRLNPVTRHTLELAKQNFLRYSCVILQEQWKDTSSCMSSKLGLHLSSDSEFNVEGHLRSEAKAGESSAVRTDQHSDATFLKSLTPEEYKQLVELNALDLEFYEWAKEQILDGAFTSEQQTKLIASV